MSVYTSPVPTPAHMYVETRCASPGTVVVAVAGEVDMATASALHAALVDALSTYPSTVVDIDLSQCTFLDCSGIRVLVAARVIAQASGHQIWARYPQRLVRTVLELTGLLDVFTAPNDTTARNAASEEGLGPAPPRTVTQTVDSAPVAA